MHPYDKNCVLHRDQALSNRRARGNFRRARPPKATMNSPPSPCIWTRAAADAAFNARPGPREPIEMTDEMTPLPHEPSLPPMARFYFKLADVARIIGAVLLQDMRTRFGRSSLSYLIAVLWPLSHLSFLVLAYLFTTKIAPIGDDPVVFLGTGLLPYILSFYPARMMAFAILQNRQLLNIPLLKPIHLIIGRCILEILTALVVCALFCFILYMLDVDFAPSNPSEAALAIAASIYLGVGLGFFNVVMCALFGQYFIVAYVLSFIALYIFAGIYFPTYMMPEALKSYMLYNPLLNLVEWLRSAYYASYDTGTINKGLVLGVATVSLALGLLGERFLRGKFFT
jgi:capsular polysaccharide transport system permease protein